MYTYYNGIMKCYLVIGLICSMKYCCYAMIVRRNTHCLVTASKHVNDIRAIARQSPMTIEGLLEAVISIGSTPRLYSEDPGWLKAVQLSEVVGW
jgi:hypothetical protein